MSDSKTCPDCGIEKPLSEFYDLRNGKYKSTYCKRCVSARSARYAKDNPVKRRMTEIRHQEKSRGTSWGRAKAIYRGMATRSNKKGFAPPEFSREEIADIIESGRCAKTGIPFILDSAIRLGPWNPTPDRIDSLKGYSKDNVQWVCAMYNSMKAHWDEEDVQTFVYALTTPTSEEVTC